LAYHMNKCLARHNHALHSHSMVIHGTLFIAFKHIACININFRRKKNCTIMNSSCILLYLSLNSWNLSYEKWGNNKILFGQISGLNKEIKFCLLSCLLKHHLVLHTWNCSNPSLFPSLFHSKHCFHFHGGLS